MKLERGEIRSVKILIYDCIGGAAIKGKSKCFRVYETTKMEVCAVIESALKAKADGR